MKEERLNRRHCRTRKEALAEVIEYIEWFYDSKRRHSTLGGIRSTGFEKRAERA
jgi:putative transposase